MNEILTKTLRQSYMLASYTVGLTASLWLAFLLRFDFHIPAEYLVHIGAISIAVVGTKLALLLTFGQFGSLLSYFSFHDLGKLLGACAIAAALTLVVWLAVGVPYSPPRAVIVTDFLISFFYLCGFRLSLRLLREGYFDKSVKVTQQKRVAIIGAGNVGAALAKDLLMRRGLGMSPEAFFDDDPKKWHSSIHGVAVVGSPDLIPAHVSGHARFDEIIIAMPGASGRRMKEIVHLLIGCGLKFEIVPSVEQLITGKVRVSQIRPVEIQDLLGRDPVCLETTKIRDLIHGNVVMVTGAGGSIGGELSRQITSHSPRLLMLVERCEAQLFQIEQELINLGSGAEVVSLVADILDESRMRSIFERFAPQIIFHAAAHKHVPLMEAQPAEAFRNNTIGTRRLAELACEFSVDKFLLISTDKAINPTSAMGATKRLAEIYLQALNGTRGSKTKFMAVRFGNVLGSSGSVIPTFKKQIAAGGPVTVTHPEITRYFMTVQEAVGLVLQSASLGVGGEIFVLDMGKPVKIVDVARQLIELSGLEPDLDIEIKYTGLRPGEKLFEEINHNNENHTPTEHVKIFRFVAEPVALERFSRSLDHVITDLERVDSANLKRIFQNLIPEYTPYLATT